MGNNLAVSFNIHLNEKFSKSLKDIQNRLGEKIKDQRHYDSSPHIAIATKFMPESKVVEFSELIGKEFANDKVWASTLQKSLNLPIVSTYSLILTKKRKRQLQA